MGSLLSVSISRMLAFKYLAGVSDTAQFRKRWGALRFRKSLGHHTSKRADPPPRHSVELYRNRSRPPAARIDRVR